MAAVKKGSKIPYPESWLANPWHPDADPRNPDYMMDYHYAWIGRSSEGSHRELQGTHVPEVGPDGRYSHKGTKRTQ